MKAANDSGFTLTETLTALVVVSLTLAILMSASVLLSRHLKSSAQKRADEKQVIRLAADLQDSLKNLHPDVMDKFTGDRLGFAYPCDQAAPCRFSLTTEANRYRLSYVSQAKTYAQWPQKTKTTPDLDNRMPALEALILQDQNQTTLAVVPIVSEQSMDCIYDLISRNCREQYREGLSSGARDTKP